MPAKDSLRMYASCTSAAVGLRCHRTAGYSCCCGAVDHCECHDLGLRVFSWLLPRRPLLASLRGCLAIKSAMSRLAWYYCALRTSTCGPERTDGAAWVRRQLFLPLGHRAGQQMQCAVLGKCAQALATQWGTPPLASEKSSLGQPRPAAA